MDIVTTEHTPEMVFFECVVCDDRSAIEYRLYKRENVDPALECEWVYDIVVTRRSERTTSESIRAISFTYDSALDFVLSAIRYQITPISIFDFYEEYYSG